MRKILLFVILFSLIGLTSCEFFNKPDDSTNPDNGVETEKEFNYTVKRYFEDLSGNYLIDDSKTEILKAKENENVVAEDKSYEHFVKIEHSDEVLSGKVSSDYSLTLKVYYMRERLNVVFNVEGDVLQTEELPYGATVNAPMKNIENIPGENGTEKVFKYWSESEYGAEYDFDIPVSSNMTLYAVFDEIIKTYGLSVTLNNELYTLVKPSGEAWIVDSNLNFTAVTYGTEFEFKVSTKENVVGNPLVNVTTYQDGSSETSPLLPDSNGVYKVVVQENIKIEISGLTKMKTIEFDDTSLGYFGSWGVFEDAWYLGNRAHGSYTKDDYLLISVYDATSVRIWGDKSNDRGRFDVYLDGKLVETVDTYAETRTASQILFELNNLTADAHTIRIVNTGLTSGSGIWVVIDKVSVSYNDEDNIQGVNENIENTSDDELDVYKTFDDSSYGYFGSWGLYTGRFSGGFAHGSNTQGDYVLIQVKNITALKIYCEKSTDRGEAEIYVDGIYVATVSGFATQLQSEQVLWEKHDFTEGYHTVKVVNKAAPASWLVLDKIEVKYQDSNDFVAYDDASFGYEGAWGPYYDINYLGNFAHGSNVKDASFTFNVADAKNIKIYGNKGADRAKANVYVDGILYQTINTYSPTLTAVDVICSIENLSKGEHTISIVNTGETDGVDTWLVLDDISICYYDENIRGVGEPNQQAQEKVAVDYDDCMIGFVGSWACYPGKIYSGGYVNASNTSGDYFIWSFVDVKKISLYGAKGPDRGKADVYIDGQKVGTIDTYSANYTDVVLLFEIDNLEKGTHTIRIANTGETTGSGIWLLIDKVAATYYDENRIVGPNEMFIEKKQIIREVDDCSVGYYGDWRYYSLVGDAYYNGTCYATSAIGDYAVITVVDAKSVIVYGTKNPDRSKVDVYIDGVYYSTIDNYAPSFQSAIIFEIDNLSKGTHTIKFVNTCKTSGEGSWFIIDRYVTEYYEEQTGAIITASNNSFFTGNNAILHEDEEYFEIVEGSSVSVTVKGTNISLFAKDNLSADSIAKVVIDGKNPIIVNISENGLIYTVNDVFGNYHTIEVFNLSGCVTLAYLTTDDFSTTPIQLEMFEKAQENLENIENGSKIISDPKNWQPVSYEVFAPKSGVTLTGGILETLFERNLKYLNEGMSLQDYVDSPQVFWVDILSASNEGRLLQGYANSLIWGEYNANYRRELDKLIGVIRERQIIQNGNALPYDELYLGTSFDTNQGLGERKNYDRAMLTRGLIAAANYYEYIGYSDETNPAYIILREFYDWFNYNENGYGLSMLGGQLGYQGHIASTLTYFSNVGKLEDMTYAELCYVQDWWLEYLTNGTLEAIWKYPLDRTNCYMITGIEPYLDHYRATGNEKYLNACLKFWEVYREYFIHDNGVMAFCEHRNYEPNSFYLSNAKHTGELCGTVFWIDFNYKLLQLFPNEEKYANEIERGLLNVLPASQDENGKVIYHQSSNGYLQNGGRVNACCEVTSVGLKARVASFIYQLSDEGVHVSLYNDSILNTNYHGKNYYLKTTGDVFSTDTYLIENLGDDIVLSLRIPSWVSEGYYIKVNGQNIKVDGVGQYQKVSVKKGDIITVHLPKKINVIKYNGFEQVPGYSRYTIMNGPLSIAICPNGKFSSVVYQKEAILKTNYTIEDFIKTVDFTSNTAGANNEFDLVPYAQLGRKYFALYPLYNLAESGESNVIIPSKNHITGFDLFNDFDYYGTFENQNGQLISYTGKEAKAIAKNFVFEEGSAISITIDPYYTGGRIDGGLYLGVQGDVSSKIDAITGYNINVERVAGASYFDVKIHAFDYNEGKGKFLGTIGQVRIEGDVSSVELTVLYKGDKIYVYANNNVSPCMEMVVGELKGTVGVRSFMTSQRFYDMVAWEE